ncbi:hypothetical protein SCLCIDRAFT_25836 [Scleroderma citrinum Foug A]|uniref:Hydrophobin n=1 Tax=Scleroderma citrinum Foug A TaxID=1036808 RepID=A0A0C3A9G8_9AGAM|nr:hypothetical protein SCLCIDRAFT_25836 [Scleroderma citrinum Foug A]
MFFRVSTLLLPVVALSSFVAAAPGAIAARGASCATGVLQCCMSTSTATTQNAQKAGISAPVVGPYIGFQCTTFTGVGIASGANCNQQAVCCSQTGLGGGAVSMGCMPVNAQL